MVNDTDVLKPEIIQIEGRRYRKPVLLTDRKKNRQEEQTQGAYYEDDMYYDDEPLSCEVEYKNIIKVDGGYQETIKDIPGFYFRFILGPGQEKRRKLEFETKTTIKLPKTGDGDIIIKGKDRGGIIAARTKINTVFEMNRREAPAGHFLNIPLSSIKLSETFEEFKRGILKMKLRGIDESLFQYPERLHLTLSLMTFLNNAELEDTLPRLSSLTSDLQQKHFGGSKAITLRIQGVEYMNDDPSEVDVLYAKANIADGSDKFQSFIDDVVSEFSSLGFSKKDHERVKLHATIINSLFRDDPSERQSTQKKDGNKKNRITFDANRILDTYADFFFGDIVVTSLDIAVRRTFDADGRYKVAASIPLQAWT